MISPRIAIFALCDNSKFGFLMQNTNNSHRQEWLIYAVVWVLLFLFPLLSVAVHSAFDNNAPVRWDAIMRLWTTVGGLFVVFLFHNFFLAPIWLKKHQTLKYFCFTAVLAIAFLGIQVVLNENWPMKPMVRPAADRAIEQNSHPENPDRISDAPKRKHPPLDLFLCIWGGFFLFAIGSNITTKLYLKNQDSKNRLKELEKENLTQQLESLRYQVNPHFLMNTLNNIHALVDIAPEQAKSSILELSRMMRYVLHEGANMRIPLKREVKFLQNYIALMRLRYDENVDITTDFEDISSKIVIAPLLLIPFVENAFKHGVSYQHPSYINVKLFTDNEHVTMLCANSKAKTSNTLQEPSGVGLENVNRRLSLIYGENYTLQINEGDTDFNITLTLPLETENNKIELS